MIEVYGASDILAAHGYDYTQRIAGLRQIADRVFPQLDHIAWCNIQFERFGRTDLTLDDPVALPQLAGVPNPADHSHVGNFAAKFSIFTGKETVVVEGELDDYEESRRTPVTSRELLGMRDGTFPLPEHDVSHSSRPAFHRALCIEPDFVSETTADISAAKRPLEHFGPEILVLHGMMSRLVDRSDPHVLRGDGSVNTGYLCANHAKLPLGK